MPLKRTVKRWRPKERKLKVDELFTYPLEMIAQIMSELPLQDVVAFCSVNKRARTMCQSQKFWILMILARFPKQNAFRDTREEPRDFYIRNANEISNAKVVQIRNDADYDQLNAGDIFIVRDAPRFGRTITPKLHYRGPLVNFENPDMPGLDIEFEEDIRGNYILPSEAFENIYKYGTNYYHRNLDPLEFINEVQIELPNHVHIVDPVKTQRLPNRIVRIRKGYNVKLHDTQKNIYFWLFGVGVA